MPVAALSLQLTLGEQSELEEPYVPHAVAGICLSGRAESDGEASMRLVVSLSHLNGASLMSLLGISRTLRLGQLSGAMQSLPSTGIGWIVHSLAELLA
jgi:hypothetical protein